VDLVNVQAFLQVAEQGSFSAAAASLHLTQPAVSKRIAALETDLGLRLFDRIGRHTQLTEPGRVLLPKARALLNDVADIRRSLSNLSQAVSGPLVIATSHHIGLRRLPSVLRWFSRQYPEVRLDIRFMDSETGCLEVARGVLELAIVTLPPEAWERLELIPLWHDPLVFVVSRDHDLAARTGTTLQQLLQYPSVLPGQGTYTRAILEQEIQPRGLRIQHGMATNYLETIRMLVAVGLGWSLLPETLVDQELQVLDVEGLRLSRVLGAVRHRGHTLSNAASALLDTCRLHGCS